MLDICRERADRRKTSSVSLFIMCTVPAVGSAVTGNLSLAVVYLALMFLIVILLPWFLIGREQRVEAKRRLAGSPPSWPAKLPTPCLQTLGGVTKMKPEHAVSGRLILQGSRWNFRSAAPAAKNLGTTPVVDWDGHCPVIAERTYGRFSPGVLTFDLDAGRQISVEVRNPQQILREASAQRQTSL